MQKSITKLSYVDESNQEYAFVVIESEDNKLYNIVKTFVDESHRGEGLAGKLMERAVEHINKLGGGFKADCSYAAHYLDKHKISYK